MLVYQKYIFIEASLFIDNEMHINHNHILCNEHKSENIYLILLLPCDSIIFQNRITLKMKAYDDLAYMM